MPLDEHPPLSHLSDEENLFRETVRSFAENEVRPLAPAMDAEEKFRPDLLRRFFEMGLMAVETPESLGGSGSTFFMSILAVEELSRADGSSGVVCDVQNTLINNALLRWANRSQQEEYLPRLASEWVGAYALSEAESGSDAFALRTTAAKSGDGWCLNGRKLWVTNAMEAGLFIVFATIDPTLGYRGITAFLVERDRPGLELGRKEEKLGIRASSTCEVVLENCLVPAENLMGEVGKGYRIAIETLNEGRIGIGAQMVGIASAALEAATSYAHQRVAFGRTISEFQAVQFSLASMATELEAARLLVYNAARLREAGADFTMAAAQAKYFSSVMAGRVTSAAVEIFGGYGYTRDYPVERYFRDAKIGTIYEGTSNMQLATIARKLLGGEK